MKYFEDIDSSVELFRKHINAAIAAAKKANTENQNRDLSEYRFPDKIRSDRAKEIQRALSAAVSKERADLANAVRYNAFQIRQDLQADRQTMPGTAPQTKALDRLALFQKFGIPMNVEDAETIAADLAGNNLGLRALAAVAEKSDIAVELPNKLDAEAILTAFEKASGHASLLEFSSPEYSAAVTPHNGPSAEEVLSQYTIDTGKPAEAGSTAVGSWLATAQAAEFNSALADMRRLSSSLENGGTVKISKIEKKAEMQTAAPAKTTEQVLAAYTK